MNASFILTGILVLWVSAACGEDSFSEWVKRDGALQRDAGKSISVAPFEVTLPLGWVQDGGVPGGDAKLRHIGPQGALTDGVAVTLRTEPADPDFVWPSSLSGNTPVKLGAPRVL